LIRGLRASRPSLLRAVALYVTGGIAALAARHNAGAVKLLEQLR
jgi:hypothetical protein